MRVAGQIIKTTAEHPFWVKDYGWVTAGELEAGDQFSTHEGDWITLNEIHYTGEWTTVYNFRVQEDHTYFVGQPDWNFAVWVHNTHGQLSGAFSHGWIKHDLYNQLTGLVGKADKKKFVAAVQKGVVPPHGHSGIKALTANVGPYTHELKIGGSAQRLLGKVNEAGVMAFDKFVAGGLH